MPTFKLDGKEIPFETGDTIIAAAARVGIEIPHYCWHPGLSIAANCRMCLIEVMPSATQRSPLLDILEWDATLQDYRTVRKPKLQPACQMAATEGAEIQSNASENVAVARKAVQEFLLLNHPVDCPICDQSGECKLQDYWLEYGRFKKRMGDEPVHKPKAVVFGPTIVYDAERCVMCTRCIRFMDEVAHDPVLEMRERGNHNEICVADGHALTGHYTFMTEHVCPVGALTTKDFRFKARVWFLRTAKSICQGCATGCNSYLDYDPRYNRAYRHRPRDNEQVNKYWMCDEGMLSYRRIHEDRVSEPRLQGKTVSASAALQAIKQAFAGVSPNSVAVVFSAQHSLEDNWALRELAKTLLGTTSFYVSGLPDGYEDKILIHRDKNPNREGVAALARDAKSFADLVTDIRAGRATHVIALGGEAPLDHHDGEPAFEKLQAMVTIAAHDGPLTRAATVVLPATTWAEASGTYVNAKGIRQVADKALEPIGGAAPAWTQIAHVARSLGLNPQWGELKQIRTRLSSEVPAQTATSSTQTES